MTTNGNRLTVEVAELRAALTRVLDALEHRFGVEMTFEFDLYRALPVEEAFDILGPEPAYTMGSLADDLQSMLSYNTEPEPTESIWHEIAHLGGILRAIEHRDRPARGSS
ncbi:hypothetical protein D1871_18835 [Nakamurella silvestris]|nr:hypothetical protein D1871_18835 [Nakamurella silvestris]